MAEAIGAGWFPGSADRAARDAMDIVIGTGELDSFGTRAGQLLTAFGASEAAPGRAGGDRLTRDRLGGGFAEADFLYAALTAFHDHLEALSRALALELESMSRAVRTSRVDHLDLDEDLRSRMRALNAGIDAMDGRDREPYGHDRTGGRPAPPDATVSSDGSAGRTAGVRWHG